MIEVSEKGNPYKSTQIGYEELSLVGDVFFSRVSLRAYSEGRYSFNIGV
jgi:hypothetical protein